MPSNHSNDYFWLIINGNIRNDSEDSISIYKGGKLVATFSNSTGLSSYKTNIFPHSPVFIKFHTGPSPSIIYRTPTVSMSMIPRVFSYERNIMLTEENPVFALNISQYFNGYYTISVPEGYTLDVSIAVDNKYNNVRDEYDVYDGLDLVGK